MKVSFFALAVFSSACATWLPAEEIAASCKTGLPVSVRPDDGAAAGDSLLAPLDSAVSEFSKALDRFNNSRDSISPELAAKADEAVKKLLAEVALLKASPLKSGPALASLRSRLANATQELYSFANCVSEIDNAKKRFALVSSSGYFPDYVSLKRADLDFRISNLTRLAFYPDDSSLQGGGDRWQKLHFNELAMQFSIAKEGGVSEGDDSFARLLASPQRERFLSFVTSSLSELDSALAVMKSSGRVSNELSRSIARKDQLLSQWRAFGRFESGMERDVKGVKNPKALALLNAYRELCAQERASLLDEIDALEKSSSCEGVPSPALAEARQRLASCQRMRYLFQNVLNSLRNFERERPFAGNAFYEKSEFPAKLSALDKRLDAKLDELLQAFKASRVVLARACVAEINGLERERYLLDEEAFAAILILRFEASLGSSAKLSDDKRKVLELAEASFKRMAEDHFSRQRELIEIDRRLSLLQVKREVLQEASNEENSEYWRARSSMESLTNASASCAVAKRFSSADLADLKRIDDNGQIAPASVPVELPKQDATAESKSSSGSWLGWLWPF